jgi:hypothetical protein
MLILCIKYVFYTFENTKKLCMPFEIGIYIKVSNQRNEVSSKFPISFLDADQLATNKQ